MPEVEGREEVVNGEIRLMPPTKVPHALIVAKLLSALFRQLDDTQYDILSGSFGIVIRKSPITCRIPDVAVFEKSTEIIENGYFHSPPQLAVEVLSPSETRRIKEEKLRDYESIRFPEVWIISPEAETVEVLLLQEDRLRRTAILHDGVLSPQALPGLKIDVSAIWPR